MGRTPKPTALKILEGNPGHRPIDLRAEPTPAPNIPECPEFLDAVAKKEWFRLCNELHELGLLTNLDRSALGACCSAYSQWAWAEIEIGKLSKLRTAIQAGLHRKRTKVSRERADKEVNRLWGELCTARGLRKNAMKEMTSAGDQLGLSPASRTRIRVEPPDLQMDLPGMEATESAFEKTQRLARRA